MLEQKFDIKWDPLNAKQQTPLHLAAENGHHQIVKQLLNLDPKIVHARDCNGFTALHCACQNNLLMTVKAFEEQMDFEEVLEAQTLENNTPLHIACMNGDESLDVVNYLIKKNANVYAANKNGETPIHISASRGNEQLTNILLEKGADVDVQDGEGRTPVILAAISDHKPVISLLLPKTSLRKSVTRAVLQQREDVLSRLLDASTESYILIKEVLPAIVENNVEFIQILANKTGTKYLAKPIDGDGNTPLHFAAIYGHHEIVEALLGARPVSNQWLWYSQENVQVDAENENHRTPLHQAAERGHLQVVEQLISYHRRNAIQFKCGTLTPMHLACQNGHEQVVKAIATMVPEWVDSSDADNGMRTPLHVASENGYVKVVEILVKHKAKLKAMKDGITPIHMAVQEACIEVVRVLLPAYPDEVNTADMKKKTPLHLAARYCGNHPGIVTELLESGADVGALDSRKYTPLMVAAAWNNDALLREMMDKDMAAVEKLSFNAAYACDKRRLNFLKLVLKGNSGRHLCSDCKDREGNTILHIAASTGKAELIDLMIEQKFDIKWDPLNARQQTPLHLATENGHHQIVRQLLNRDSEVLNYKDSNGFTALHCACQNNLLKVVKAFEEQLDLEVLEAQTLENNTPLHIACMNGDESLDVVNYLIEMNANIHATNKIGETPIHISASRGYEQLTNILLEKGADVDVQDGEGRTPVILAAISDHTPVISLLLPKTSLRRSVTRAVLQQREDILSRLLDASTESHILMEEVLPAVVENNVEFIQTLADMTGTKYLAKPIDGDGNTPLHFAAIYGHHEIVETLLGARPKPKKWVWQRDYEVKVDAENKYHRAPLHLAAEYGHLRVVSSLLKCQSKFKTGGLTPMHLACRKGHYEVVKEIASFVPAADWIDAANSHEDNNTPLHVACKCSHKNIMTVLLEHGAKLSLTREGLSPVHLAVRDGFTDGLEILLKERPDSVNCRDKQNRTLLHYAGELCHNSKIIALLIERGGNLEAVIRKSFTPILTAVHFENYVAFNTMVDKGGVAIKLTLFQAAKHPDQSTIRALQLISKVCAFSVCYHSRDKDGNSPLHTAACCDNLQAVKVFLEWQYRNQQEKRLDLVQNADGKLSIHLAAEHGYYMIVEEFIRFDPKLTMACDNKKLTLLHIASQCGHLQVARVIFNSSNEFEVLKAADENGNTPLYLACESGNIDIVEFLIESGANITTVNSRGEIPLHVASQQKSVEIVQLLLDSGDHTMIEQMDDSGYTSLHHAAENNQTNQIKFFHQRGANVYAEDHSLCTPVLIAAASKNNEAFQCLMTFLDLQDDQKNPVFKALNATQHRIEILQFLITDTVWGATLIKSTDNEGNRVLHITARDNDLPAMAVLLAHKVDSCIENAEGKTPMHLAAENGHHEVVLELMMYDSKLVTSEDNGGMTPLHLACLHGHVESVQVHKERLWLNSESLREHRNAEGNTPFHLGCAGGSVGVVELLIGSEVNTMAPNKLNETPLHIAVRSRHVHIVQVLLNIKVPTERHTLEGHTPLHYAAKENNAKMIKILDGSGADLYAKDNNYCTPAHTAAMHQCVDAYHCLMECIPDSAHASVIFTSFEVKCNREIILKFLVSDWKYGEKLVNATNDAEHTPLHVASERGNQEAVNILLQHGACGCSPVIVSHPERRCVDLGKEVVTFRCKATGTPPLEYSWKFNGNVLEGETKSTLTIDEVSCKDTGIYQCCVTNRFDDVTSNPAELRIAFSHLHHDPTYPGAEFYDQTHSEQITSESQTVAKEDLGVTVNVPSGAVAAGKAVDLTVRPCLNGQFILPEGYKPASPVYLIRASTDFLQDVQVSIEHFADLQSKRDCDNMAFLFANTTPVDGPNGPEYRFEECPADKFIFKEGQTVGTVAQRHFAFTMVAKRQGVSVYSLLLYSSLSPSLEQNMAVFCITPCHQLYQKNASAVVKEVFPKISHLPSVIAPVHLSDNVVSLEIPPDISGWHVVPDRSPPKISQDQMDLALSNPDYAQLSNIYPPKILLTISHVPVTVQGQLPDDCCYIGVNGTTEGLVKFTLHFPSHPSSDPVHVPPDQPKCKGEGILAEGDLPNLLDLLRTAFPHWRNVGVYLSFHSSELDVIERMPLRIPEGCPGYFTEMLCQWLKWAPPNHPYPTVLNLASALRRAGEEATAFHLEIVFGINVEERCAKANALQKSMMKKVTALRETNAAVQTELQTHQENVKTKEKEVASLRETNAAVQTELKAKQEEVATVREANTAVQTELKGKQEEVATLRETKTALQTELKAKQEEVATLRETNTAKQEEVERLQKQLEDHQTCIVS